MKKLLTIATMAIAALAISSQAQAYDGPSFSKCVIETSGVEGSLLILGGSATRGTIKCKKTNGSWVAQNVVLPMGGINLGFKTDNPLSFLGSLLVRQCPMDVKMTLVGAELNINLTPTVLNKIIRLMKVVEVMNPVKPGQTGVATLGINNADFGVFAGLGRINYSDSCVKIASVQFGALVDEGTYDRRQQERMEQQNNR